MQDRVKTGNRMVGVRNGVIGPLEPRKRSLQEKQIGDYPGVPGAYLEVAEIYGPSLMGPPLCDELMALIQHMFTEEEASIVRHLKPGNTLSAEQVATAEHRPVEEVEAILEHLTTDLCILMSVGCGQCLVTCEKNHAIELVPVPGYQPPPIAGART